MGHHGKSVTLLCGHDSGFHLSRRLDAFTDAEVDDEPGEEQAADQVPLEGSWLVYTTREVQHVVPAASTR